MYHFNYKMMVEYWKENDRQSNKIDWSRDPEGLSNVCYNNAPIQFNRLIAKFQQNALFNALKMTDGLVGKKVLEIGCGTGRWVKLMKERGAIVTGIDLQERVIDRNRSLISNAEFICGDFLDYGFLESIFDMILSVTVLQHLPYESQDAAIKKIFKILKSNGYVIILENCKDVAAHVFSNSVQEWIRKFESNGFKCIYSRGYGYHLILYFVMALPGRFLEILRRKKTEAKLPPQDYLIKLTTGHGLLKNLYWWAVILPVVYFSYPLEYFFEKFPVGYAKHACFVFKKL